MTPSALSHWIDEYRSCGYWPSSFSVAPAGSVYIAPQWFALESGSAKVIVPPPTPPTFQKQVANFPP